MNETWRFANVPTPTPGVEWIQMSADNRVGLVKNTLATSSVPGNSLLVLLAAHQDGHVVFQFTEPVGPERRGTILLDVEELLKKAIDPGLFVSLEPLGDRNSLRNLRGIEVKL